MKDDAGILARKLFDEDSAKARGKRNRGSDPQVSRRGVGEKLHVLDGLPQFIECDDAAIEQGASVNRGLDTLGATVEEPDAERVLHVSNRPGYGRLRHR